MYNDYVKSYEQLLQIGNNISLRKYRIIHFAIELYKVKRGESVDMLKCFDIPKEISYNLRNKEQNSLPRPNTTTYGIKSFRYLSSHIWNQIPDTIKQAKDVTTFKKTLLAWNGFKCKCSLCDM